MTAWGSDMDIATFNVNSLRVRLDALRAWLEEARPDVVALQETKVTDDLFPRADLEALGYHVAFHGQKTYNGVALLSRQPLEAVETGIPGFADGEARVIRARTGGVQVVGVYVPNGQDVDTDKYRYKLRWLDAFVADLTTRYDPGQPLVALGDFNIAPEDHDTWDPAMWKDQILCTAAERAPLRALLDWGLSDALRRHHAPPGPFTFWDFREGRFWRGQGLRIDHVLLSRPLADRCTAAEVAVRVRKRKQPSDHAPVVVRVEIP